MNFTNGYWLMRDGLTLSPATEIVDYNISEDIITLYVATKHIENRGQTLDGSLLKIKFSSPRDDIIGVKISHFEGLKKQNLGFEIKSYCVNPKIFDNDDKLIFISGKSKVEIYKNSWNVKFYYEDKFTTGMDWRSTAYILDEVSEKGYIREQLHLGVNECIYGLGERFGNFVKNGQQIDIWNEDGGTCTAQAYKNIPFYLSSNNYGLFVNDTCNVSFEVGSEHVSRVQFSVLSESLEYFVIGGSPKDVIGKYTDITGKPTMVPSWSFGLWLSTSFTTNYDEETVNSFIDKMAEYDIPLQVFHFDCFWMKAYEWCNFEWDPKVFPNPKEMLQRLKAKGLKICVWINPYIGQKSPLFAEGSKKGYFLIKKNGDVWQKDIWQSGMAIVDFTNPEACSWFQDGLRKLIEMGVDCFKTDFGERIPTDVNYFNGAEPIGMHNYYTYLYNKCVYDILVEAKGEEEAILFARSATAGCQQFPVHWGGDSFSDFDSMAESLRGGLSFATSGFAFWSHDISGFESDATPDVYKRWTQFGLLSTHSRLHGSSGYRVPWAFDDEAVDVLRYFTKLKCRLMPYIFNKSIEACKAGIPVMQSMFLNFPEDLNCRYISTQYMLGENLIVAPIFNDVGEATYYLPYGTWTNILSNKKYSGGKWYTEIYDYFSLPLMVKENTILPIGGTDNTTAYDFSNGLSLNFFDVENAELSICNQDKTPLGVVIAVKKDNLLDITLKDFTKTPTILIRNIFEVTSVEGADVEITKEGLLLKPYDTKINLIHKGGN